MEAPLVSIIMPARNAEDTIAQAVSSVIEQSWQNWQLIVVVNATSDRTAAVIQQIQDPRIIRIDTPVAGLSNARNIGMSKATGAFICFLDADDRLPKHSLECRVHKFQQRPELSFVDGKVITFDNRFDQILREWTPSFRGTPGREMARFDPGCFSSISWMIRVRPDMPLNFDTSWTHLEDRVFFLSIADKGQYDFVDEDVYHIRRRPGSLMSDHSHMETAFLRFLHLCRDKGYLDERTWVTEKRSFHRVFMRTYLRNLRLFRALRHAIALI